MRMLVAASTAAAMLVAACSSAQPSFSVTGASVDPIYWCPGGANNAPYDLRASIEAHNGTSHAVTIDSITAEMKLAAVKGSWLEKVGDLYDAGSVKFDPATVPAGSTTTINATIRSACTSGRYGSSLTSSGDYVVTIRVSTSAGTYSIAARNHHQILAA